MLRLIQNRTDIPPRLPLKQPQDELVALAEVAARGDSRAVRTLIHAVGPHLLRTIRAVLGREHPAIDDVAQEAVVEFLGALGSFRAESTVIHFACRVAVLCAMHFRRRESARKRSASGGAYDPELDNSDAWVSQEPDPERRAETHRSSTAVLELLEALPEPQAHAFALHAVLGYTVSEIANALEIPQETVRSRLRLARQALRHKVLHHPVLREAAEEP